MTQYWCVNFDSDECLRHGIKCDIWMMQYQYEDDLGNVFQGGKQKSATTANWNRLTKIKAGDWCVAYLPKKRTANGNAFFAIGRACVPRKPAKPGSHVSTVAQYVSAKRSHEIMSGVVHYADAPIFYEDFDDKWRSDNSLMRYAQRIDVEAWQHYVASGVPWPTELEIPPNEIQRAFFRINKRSFDRITKQLIAASGSSTKSRTQKDSPSDIVDESAIAAIEKGQAKSQGFTLDSKLRAALEKYAMDAATQHFVSLGYTVEDRSKNQPYDLKCVGKGEVLYVEVKGTQANGKEIILTSGEVNFAQQNTKQMVLFILHSIQVSKDHEKLSKGVPIVVHPWAVDHAALTPLSYKCAVRMPDAK